MRRVLLVSPRFAPTAAPDSERGRRLLPYLAENGWVAEVLAARPELSHHPKDPWLLKTVPDDAAVHRVSGLGLGFGRIPGLGSLGVRTLRRMDAAGARLLETGGFDLVYFATTVVEAFSLGPRWKQRFGVPFVIDYQDPWVNDFYGEHPDVRPPGGRLKYGVVDMLSRRTEPRVLRECLAITSVSPAYPEQLSRRYPDLGTLPALVEPFPIPNFDHEVIRAHPVQHSVFDPRDGRRHWVYMGHIAPGMIQPIRMFFRALSSEDEAFREHLQVHFVGTTYARAEGAQPVLEPLVAEYRLRGVVTEQPARIPYSEALAASMDADALLAFGSNERGYVASKLLPNLALEKPVLAIFHGEGASSSMLRELGLTGLVAFGDEFETEEVASRIRLQWPTQDSATAEHSRDTLARFSAAASTARLCGFFDGCLSTSSGAPPGDGQ